MRGRVVRCRQKTAHSCCFVALVVILRTPTTNKLPRRLVIAVPRGCYLTSPIYRDQSPSSQQLPIVAVQRCGELPGAFLADGSFAVFHLADMVLGDAGKRGELLLG